MHERATRLPLKRKKQQAIETNRIGVREGEISHLISPKPCMAHRGDAHHELFFFYVVPSTVPWHANGEWGGGSGSHNKDSSLHVAHFPAAGRILRGEASCGEVHFFTVFLLVFPLKKKSAPAKLEFTAYSHRGGQPEHTGTLSSSAVHLSQSRPPVMHACVLN